MPLSNKIKKTNKQTQPWETSKFGQKTNYNRLKIHKIAEILTKNLESSKFYSSKKYEI